MPVVLQKRPLIMRLYLCVLLAVVCAIALADEESWRVYYPEAFDEEELCRVLSCQPQQVCLVKGANAFCLNTHQLHEIHGLKIDSRTGLVINPEEHAQSVQAKIEQYEKRTEHMQALVEKDINEVDSFIRKHMHDHQTEQHTHSQRHANGQHECDVKQMKDMGVRLMKWFTDVHHQMQGDIAPLPRHRISCGADVSWMFQQWDGDKDGELSLEELNSLEGDRYEPCIAPFLDRCDDNADNAISLDEWCDCFLWVGQERKEPPCHRAKHAVDPHLMGSFVPRCDVDGYYRVEQCHEDQCWCADKWGREFDRSRTIGKRPDCAQYAENDDDEEVNADTIVKDL